MAEKGKRADELLEALGRRGKAEKEEAAPEDVSLDVVARREADALQAELHTLWDMLAEFEAKYRMTLEEFQVQMGPEATAEEERDYWEWSRLAEAYRLKRQQYEDALRRASARVRLPKSEEERGEEPERGLV